MGCLCIMLKQNNENAYTYAGFLVRLAAYIVDSFIIGILLIILNVPKFILNMVGVSILDTKVLFNFSVWEIILYLLSATYFVVLTYYFGKTVGKRVMKIKVISSEKEKLSFWNAVYREVIGKYLSGLLCGIGYLTVIFDNKKRAVHDMLCDTLVVYDFDKSQDIILNIQDSQEKELVQFEEIEHNKEVLIDSPEIKEENIIEEDVKIKYTEDIFDENKKEN